MTPFMYVMSSVVVISPHSGMLSGLPWALAKAAMSERLVWTEGMRKRLLQPSWADV